MKNLLLLFATLCTASPILAADNFQAKDGNAILITKRAIDTGGGVLADANILLDNTNTRINPATRDLQSSMLLLMPVLNGDGGSLSHTTNGALEGGGNLAALVQVNGSKTDVACTAIDATAESELCLLKGTILKLNAVLAALNLPAQAAGPNAADVVVTPTLDLTTLNATTTPVPIAGQGSGTIVVPALGGATIVVETTSDSGTTWITHGVHQAGIGGYQSPSSTITAAGVYRTNANSLGAIRLRVSVPATGAGSITPTFRLTAGSGIVNANALVVAGTTGGAIPVKLITTASTNATLVATGIHTLYSMTISGLNPTASFVHLIDSASANCALASAQTYLVIGSAAAQGGLNVPIPSVGEAFVNGLTLCVTGAAADGDTSAGQAGILVNLSYK